MSSCVMASRRWYGWDTPQYKAKNQSKNAHDITLLYDVLNPERPAGLHILMIS